MNKLNVPLNINIKHNTDDLHHALNVFDMKVAADEINKKVRGETTREAIKTFQKKHKLPQTGRLNKKTLSVFGVELFDLHHTHSKTRTKKLHELLEKAKFSVSLEEKNKKIVGEKTRTAIVAFQKKHGLEQNGKLGEVFFEKLHDANIKNTLSTKNQIGKLQSTLINVNTIAKLEIEIDPSELKEKKLGDTSQKLIRAFQKKYNLSVTGEVNKATLDKITSVSTSKGKFVKKLKAPAAKDLKTVTKTLRLNMVSPHVAEMHKSLAFLGYKISENEYNTQAFGKTTIKAIKELQKQKGIAQTGHFDRATQKVVNSLAVSANPKAATTHRYRIRGSVRDEFWQRKKNMVIMLYGKTLEKETAEPIAAKKNFLNGFFDIAYDAPINPDNGKISNNFHLVVKLFNEADQNNPVAIQTHFNMKPIHWVNFTANRNADGKIEYNGKYLGEFYFEVTEKIIQKALGSLKIEDLQETETDKQISQLSLQIGLSADEIMRHILSRLVTKSVNVGSTLTPEVFYAFINQNLPADLPGDLLRGTSDWETIDHLIELTASGIVFLDDDTQLQILDNAISQNLVSQKIKINKDAIVKELQKQRNDFALTKPILVGNGNIQTLLDQSTIKKAHYSTISSVFLNNGGINSSFWEEIKTHEATIGVEAIADFTTTVESGNVSKNHLPTITFLKKNIGSAQNKPFKKASDLAKLNQDGFVEIINKNNKNVPDNMPGDTVNEKVANFAAAMKSRVDFLYPAVSLVATIKKDNIGNITKINQITKFIDKQESLDFKKDNIDQYLLNNPSVAIDNKTLEELKIVQRIHKISNDSVAGATLVANGLHSSMQIYFIGQERLSVLMSDNGVGVAATNQIYESSKMQYMQILARLMEYRREIHRDTPAAIVSHIYSKDEIQKALGDIPNLESLFGSLDYCDCQHCKSLYSPAAYLTDLLRYLETHLAVQPPIAVDPPITVKDVLFDRRSDIGNIKLNCINTNTPLPYIDLVCEILENNIVENNDFIYQTTLSQNELRATPEYIQNDAYNTIANADYPLNSSFNLWQEETRAYLNHLRVPRYELMEAFQDKSDTNNKKPDDASIAAEYFGISAKEKDLITTKRSNAADQDKYWGADIRKKDVSVARFMDRAKLSYRELLGLLLVKFVNDPTATNVSKIKRPVDTCDVNQQTLTNLTVSKFDLIHRFLRLWRNTEWEMWKLDLLIRKIGGKQINKDTLVNLKHFHQLQGNLKLPFESLLTFYDEINREVRIEPENPDVVIQPLYNQLFQSLAVTNPVDEHFKALDVDSNPIALNNSIVLGVNAAAPHNGYSPVSTILSSLALQQSDFVLLEEKTDSQLSVESLSQLFRYTYLARSLKLSIKDLLLHLRVINNSDPFSSIETTLEVIQHYGDIKASGLTLIDLDYILNYSSDSSAGLRDDSIIQLIESLRNTIELSKEKIDQLELSLADRNSILAFDADALLPMTVPQLVSSLDPLKSLLESTLVNFTNATFSVEETSFVINFDTASATDNNKMVLVEKIKLIQTNIEDLLTNNKNQIISSSAISFGLTNEQAKVILEDVTLTPGSESLLEILGNENLIEKQADGSYKDIDSSIFPDYFNAYSLLHKISLLVSNMDIGFKNLKWFINNHGAVNVVDFSVLPISTLAAANDYEKWHNLFLFIKFKSLFPEPEDASIRSVLDLATDAANSKEDIIAEIAKLTQWELEDISQLHEGLKIQHIAGNLDYTEAKLYFRLLKCIQQIKLSGVDAETMFNWATINSDAEIERDISVQARQGVKSKYEQNDWLEKATPLHDEIRNKKREALVAYLLDDSQRNKDPEIENGVITNPLYWVDSNSLYKYFLIDVEMRACQLTSRIKQALTSIQLFVQRCFLNLEKRYVLVTQSEKDDRSSPNAWSQWKWMKNYRVWEANRKVFFYPENWIEPELRDDKSPFFEELENELLQNEITNKNVETAFLNYLHKVDEVSHLEVCGLYHQMEDLNLAEDGYETNIVHVIGRTKAIPNIYYYRTYDMNYSTWSSWEKIDVDITGDHITPVAYNRKLYIFWLQFMEKPMKVKKVPAAQPTTGPADAPEPLKILEVQLAWSFKKPGGWTPKKISKQKLIHPWERPHYSYNLKPYYLSKFNELYLDIYISTSREFNNSVFYDPNKKLNPSGYVPYTYHPLVFSPSLKNPTRLTKNNFNETYLPWHSSAFVFDGDVKDVKLKGLGGKYTVLGVFSDWGDDSYDYVHDNFGRDGEMIKELDPVHEYGPRLKLPNGMHFNNTRLTNNRYDSINNKSLKVLENSSTSSLLAGANSPFELVITQQDLQLNTMSQDHPMFYQDSQRAFFIKPEWETRLNNYGQLISKNRKYRFLPFYHPYTLLFIREFNRDGIDGLLNRKIQKKPESFQPKNTFSFGSYFPTSKVIVGGEEETSQKNKDIVDFSFGAANSTYNWELFFHAPLMIASRLMQNQKFEDAMHWFHYIFDPTNIEDYPTPQRYWVTKPFFNYNSTDYRNQRIESILSDISQKENSEQLKAWRNNPFKPHVIARYRPVAYQKNVVMKYLDNLIAWGDMLFRRDSIESINEASLLYMLAHEILGDRPQKVPNVEHKEATFNELQKDLDDFGNAKVDVVIEDTLLPITVIPSTSGSEPIPKLETLYFCIPNNDFLSKYWDTVEDRLFKIRHCMNIQGIVRQLPLFEPPIDPALLVKAAAGGVDFGSVLNDLSAPTPFYRFRIVVQKAVDFSNEVKILGDRLLSALEKKDIENLSLLRSQHEMQLLQAVKDVRKKQIDEAVETIGSLNKSFESAEERRSYYEGKDFVNIPEGLALGLNGISLVLDGAIAAGYIVSGGLKLIPNFLAGAAGFGGSPTVNATMGGQQIGNGAEMAVRTIQSIATALDKAASLSTTVGSYINRKDDWDFQGRLATIEKDQIQFQINAAEIRQAIAEKDLENQELQIENAETIDDYMRNKFTNEQLYSWMITQVSTIYFQAYQLAYDMAKKAEKCYQYELGVSNSNIIQFGYWDSLKKGLLSGDKLMADLRRLEAEYINQNRREYEITKHISLAQMIPLSLITLKQTGTCLLTLPEWLFDMDYPGHYMRRIKNVTLSIPCITGPYTSINCTLSLLRNETRINSTLLGGDYEKQEDDTRFNTMFGAISSIATSHAQNDSGMFELNFNDERYLPFEGAGVISDWQINMPIENNYFDFASLSDVILHISYTSRNGGLAKEALAAVQDKLPNQSARLFSLKHEFESEWYRFLNPEGGNNQEFVVTLTQEHFPFFIRGKLAAMKIKRMDVYVESSINEKYIANITVTNANPLADVLIDKDPSINEVHHSSEEFAPGSQPSPTGEIKLLLKVESDGNFKSLDDSKIDDVFILFQLGI